MVEILLVVWITECSFFNHFWQNATVPLYDLNPWAHICQATVLCCLYYCYGIQQFSFGLLFWDCVSSSVYFGIFPFGNPVTVCCFLYPIKQRWWCQSLGLRLADRSKHERGFSFGSYCIVDLSCLVWFYCCFLTSNCMEVNLSHRILKIKSHYIFSTEYLSIEITYTHFFATEFNSLKSQQIVFTFIFQCSKILNLIFNVKKCNVQNLAAKFNVWNSVLTSGTQGRAIEPIDARTRSSKARERE